MQTRADEFARGLVADDEGGGDAETNASIVSETWELIAVTPPRVRAALSVGPAGHVRLQLTLHVNAGDSKISSPAPTTSPAEVAVSASSSDSSSYDMPTGEGAPSSAMRDAVERIVHPPQRADVNSAAQRAEMHDPSRPADQAGLRGQRGR